MLAGSDVESSGGEVNPSYGRGRGSLKRRSARGRGRGRGRGRVCRNTYVHGRCSDGKADGVEHDSHHKQQQQQQQPPLLESRSSNVHSNIAFAGGSDVESSSGASEPASKSSRPSSDATHMQIPDGSPAGVEHDLECFTKRRRVMADLRSHLQARHLQITAQTENHADLCEVYSQLAAPTLSFDWENGENASNGDKCDLEVEMPGGCLPGVRRAFLRTDIEHSKTLRLASKVRQQQQKVGKK